MYSCAYFPDDGGEPRGGAAGEARPDLRPAPARPRQPPAGDRHRLGRDGDPRRPPQRLPGDHDDDLPRAVRAGARGGSREAGLEDQVTVLLEDYRDLEGRYDRLVSVEMIEAVGWQYFDDYFRRCDELLTDDGLMLLQAITIDDRIYEIEKAARSFANTHVFPGGCLPSQGLIADCLERVTSMKQVWVDDITAHYPPTLAAWRERFFAAWERLRDARLRRALPPPLGLLPELLGGGLPRAADRRRPGALRQAGRAVSARRGRPRAAAADPRARRHPQRSGSR